MPPRSNSLDSFGFAMRRQFRKFHHVQIIETASILHVQWVSDSTMASVAESVAWSKLGHSPMSRPTTATVS